MTLALDTSAVLARYLDIPQREVVLAAMAADHDWCTAAVTRTEALAAIPHLADDPTEARRLRRAIEADWQRMAVVPVDAACLARAGELMADHPLRLANALHLAAADRLPRPVTFATFEPDQIPVALALGFEIVSA